jgi:hypothetical protein
MEIILPRKEKKVIYPIVIFKEAWGICWKHLGKLSVIYLIFNLPIVVVYLTPMASKLQNQKPSLSTFLLFFLPAFLVSIWGHIALLLGAKKAVDLEDYTIGKSISQAKVFFLKYLGVILVITLFIMGIMILGGISVAMILAILSKVNKILAVLISLALVIAILMSLVYFILRWSLATVVCVLENDRPIVALKRSLSLVTDYVHPVVGSYCLIILIYIVCLLPIIIVGAFLGIGNDTAQANRVGIMYSIFINTALVPFSTMIIVVLYKKLKEALEANVYA